MASQRQREAVLEQNNERLPRASQIQTTALERIDDTISRLNRLGITIRQSSSSKIDMRAKKFAASQNLDSFTRVCANAVQALYPGANQSLKDYLSKSMAKRYARMSFSSSRNQSLRTRREALLPIEEISSDGTQTNVQITSSLSMAMHPAVSRLRGVPIPPSVSDLSSVDIEQIRSRHKMPDEASTKLYKTSSIQVKQGNYPQPPSIDGGDNFIACEWCGEPLNEKNLSKTFWRYVLFFFSLVDISNSITLRNSLFGVHVRLLERYLWTLRRLEH